MKRGNWKALNRITMALIAVFMLLVTAPVYAIDPPHDTMNCFNCHNSAALTADGVGDHIDNTPATMLCLSCHNYTDASLQNVHSAATTGSEEWGGTWSYGCVDCHDPHTQVTARAFPTNYGAGGGARLDTGIVAGLAYGTGGILNVVTVTGKSWTPDIHAGRTMQPDMRYKYYYRIDGNTGNVLYLHSGIKGYPTLANAGRTMAIEYGALTKAVINAKRGVTNTGGYTVPGYSGSTRQVKFLNQTGVHSLANTTTDTQAICIVCHTRTKVNNMGAALNAGQFADVAPNYASNSHIGRTSNALSCWNTDGCHKGHADSFGADCDSCHGQPPIDGATLVHLPEKPITGRASAGKHLAHKNKGKDECSLCHFGAGSDDADHINNTVLGMAFEYTKANTYYRAPLAMSNGYTLAASNGNTTVANLANRQCSNIYCHSNGGNFAGTYVDKTVDWDTGTAIGCDGCHGDGAGKLIITDRHAAHVETYTFKCFECHGNTVNSSNAIISQSLHVNNIKNIGFGNLSSSSTFVYSHASGNCSNIYCHSNARGGAAAVTPNWGVAGPLACDDCHNTQGTTAAMSTNPLSSPHLKHNATDSGKYGDAARGTTAISCDQCHNTVVNEGGASLKNQSLHVNGTKNISMNVADWPAGSGTAAWNGSICSNLYCHGNNLPFGYPGGTTKTPAWSGTTSCNSCHGAPPGGAHAVDSNCSGCHDHVNLTNNGFVGGKEHQHLNGVIDTAANCGDCHGVPPQSTASMVSDPAASGRTYGDHLIHKNYSATLADCAVCHKGGGFSLEGGDANTHKAGVEIDMGFDVGGKTGGYYRSDWAALTNGFSIVSGDAVTAVANGGAAAPRTCDNIYCHSNGGNYAGTVAYKTSVNWDQTGVSACNFCHGDATYKVITDNHSVHIDPAYMAYKCYECHSTVSSPTDDGVIADKALHVNGAKNIAWGTMSTGGGAYARPNCDNNYCHSDGVNTATPYNSANTMADWTSGVGLGCADCHDGNKASGTPMATGAHGAHVNDPVTRMLGRDLGCIDCHAQSVTNDATINTTLPIKHVNRTKDVWVNIDNKACSDIQCHSNGNFGGANYAYNNPAWNTTLGCTDCHGDAATKSYPAYADGGQGTENSNTHNKHVGASMLDCEQCHATVSVNGTSINGTVPADHVNQSIDIGFKLGGTYDDVNERCSATYCHGGGQPYWGGAALDCGFCHDSSNTLPLRHDKHYATATVATTRDATNSHTAAGYVFGCGNCHPNASTHATGMASQVNHQTAEVTGSMQPQSGYTRGASWTVDLDNYEYTSNGTCTNSYCHSTGNIYGGSITYKTPAWNTAATGSCTVCHDDDTTPLASNAHDPHILNSTYNFTCEECHGGTVTGNATINTISQRNNHLNSANNVIWKTGGLNDGATAYAQPNCSNIYCHSNGGDYASAMTYRTIAWNGASILCDDCHGNTTGNNVITNAHVKHAGPGATNYTYTCYECHSTVVTGAVTVATTSGGISSYVNHLNGTKNVAWGTLATGSPAYNKAGTDCTNVYCHSNGGNYAGTMTYANLEWNAAARQCDSCHGSAGTNVLTNAHPVHVGAATYSFKCYECHSSVVDGTVTVATTSGGVSTLANHVNGTKNVAWGTLAAGSPAYNKVGTDCTNIYCHSNGGDYAGTKTYVNLEWNVAARQCDGCHGTAGVNNVNTNAHTKHVNAATYSFKCYECHSTVVTGAVTVATTSGGISTYANHVNNTKNVAWGTLSAGGSAYNKAGTDCGNIYCHSNGQATPTYANLEWTAAATTCTTCHGQGGSTSTLSAAHATHTNAATANYGCIDCHTTVVSNNTTISTYAKHVDATKEVAIPAGRGGTGTDGGNYGGSTCATTNCHGGVSRAWTANLSGSDNCTVCHGALTTAADGSNSSLAMPGYNASAIDTDGNTVATDAQVGAHYAHLLAPTNYSSAVACTNCHTVPATLNAAGHIDSTRPAEIVWSALATTNSAPANYVSGTGVCSNVYCHDGYYFKNKWSTGAYDVTWGETTYLVGTIADCSKCHGNPPPDATHGGNTDCSSCHTHVAANDISFVDKTIHVNGTVEGGGCTSCHGQPPVDTATLYSGSLGSTGRTTDYPANAWGSHATHTNAGTYGIGCGTCHNGGQPSSGNHNSGTPTYVNIGFNIFTVTTGYYTAKDFADADFDLQAGGSTTLVVGAGSRLCNNIYCHSNGKDYAGTPTYAQGNWDSLGSMAGCDDCHGNGAGQKVTTNAHPKHMGGGTNYAYACYECHSSVVNGSDAISNYPNHVNNTKNVAWGTLAAGSPAYNKAGTDCTSVYCHSNGGDYAGTKTYVDLEWNAAARQCDGCHGNQAGLNVSTNAHTKHVAAATYAFKCYECHSTVAGATVTVATTSATLTSTALHVNGTKNVAWGTLASGSPAYKSQANDCTNVYCHSNAQGTPTYNNLNWNGAATTCTTCHGQAGSTSTLSGAHKTHTDTAGPNYTCLSCHFTTVSNNTTVSDYTRHVNVTKNVAVAAARGGTATDGGDYGGSTCTTINCHGGLSKTWTANLSTMDNCTVCHGTETVGADGSTIGSTPWKVAPGNGGRDTDGDTVATDAHVGQHYAHLTTPNNYSSDIACAECHTVPAGVNTAGHIDSARPAEIVFGTIAKSQFAAAPSYTSGTSTCSNVYCHDGYYFENQWSTGTYDVTWTNSGFLVGTVADCSKCHGYPPPDTVSHNGNTDCSSCHNHVAAGDATFTDATKHIDGKNDASGGACNGCHGYPPQFGDTYAAQSTQGKGAHMVHITNLEAQYGVTRVPATDTFGNTTVQKLCFACHSSAATHNNGTREMGIDTLYQFGPAAPAYNGVQGTPGSTTPKNCSSVECHFMTSPEWHTY